MTKQKKTPHITKTDVAIMECIINCPEDKVCSIVYIAEKFNVARNYAGSMLNKLVDLKMIDVRSRVLEIVPTKLAESNTREYSAIKYYNMKEFKPTKLGLDLYILLQKVYA